MCGFMFYHGKTVSRDLFKGQVTKIRHRGPDATIIEEFAKGVVGFHRLALMDLSSQGMQPFWIGDSMLVCNGEIYNYQDLTKLLKAKPKSGSDCEVILPLILEQGIAKTMTLIDGEFAFVAWDDEGKRVLAGRDPLGVRPLFYGYTKANELMFASEMKALHVLCDEIAPFPPGHYFDGRRFISYATCITPPPSIVQDVTIHAKELAMRLTFAVTRRMHSDRPIGYLLSGGLDSSLVAAIAQSHSNQKIKTYAIGMEKDPIDLKYARIVSEYIGSDHKEITVSTKDALNCLRDVIYMLESWDITTVRASLGMYLICQAIAEEGQVKVLMSGDVSDEIFGYKYTDYAPNAQEFAEEAKKRLREIYMYDVLRADRCIAAHGLEGRIPFSDTEFVRYAMSIDPRLKMNKTGIGKYLLRKAFEGSRLLPDNILWREKAAFSDAVGHSLVDTLKAKAESLYSDSDLESARLRYIFASPISKEALWYREIFESFYPKRAGLVKDFWLPNQKWENCQSNDPSARVLPNYGKSGS